LEPPARSSQMAARARDAAGQGLLATVTAVFGLFAGLGSLLAILGGVALTIRFRASGLPTEAIVSGLPIRLFLSIGLDLTLQLLILAILAGLAAWTSSARRRAVLAVLATAVLAYPFTRIVSGNWWYALGGAALATAVVLLVLSTRVFKDQDLTAFLALLGVVVALFVVWRFVFEWTAVDVLDAKACLVNNQNPVSGLFIGEGESRIYLGVTSFGPARIVAIPGDDVSRLLIGNKVEDVRCPKGVTRPASQGK
jgi:hypothetical protein